MKSVGVRFVLLIGLIYGVVFVHDQIFLDPSQSVQISEK